jgi:N6-adenosine-specific RNA methylase IME4
MRQPHPFAELLPPMTAAEEADLQTSLRDNGYIGAPIMLHRDGRILDGRHRDRTCDRLGIVPPTETFRGEDHEALLYVIAMNVQRRHLDETQRAMVAARLPGFAHGGVRRSDQAADLPLVPQAMKARTFNVSERTIRDAVAVRAHAIPSIVQACELGRMAVSQAARAARLPEARQQQVAAEIMSGRTISTAVLSATRAQRAVEIEHRAADYPLALLGRRFSVLYCDPPWQFEAWSDGGMLKAAEMHYVTMSTAAICDMPVADIAAEHAVLFMWFLPSMLLDALRVIDAWRFKYITFGVWPKPVMSCGHWLRNQHEPFICATRGDMPPPSDLHASVFEGPASGEHSGKPDVVRDWIAGAYPESERIELFARSLHRGWHAWGNEVPGGYVTPEQAEAAELVALDIQPVRA